MATPTENVVDESQPEEVVPPQEEQQAQSQDTQEASPSEESSKDYNFRQLREVNKQLEERLRKSEDVIQSIAQSKRQSPVEEEEIEIGEEDLVEGKHLKKMEAKLAKMIQQKEMEQIPERLRNKFSDFDQVVTKENLKKLEETEPELFNTIRSGNDLFSKGVAAYKTLNSLGLSREKEDYMKNKQHVQSNHKKPVSAQAVKGQGAIHEANIFANGLTPELKKQLQREMVEAAKAR